ncbi:MAG: ATP-binding protein [Gammaproteobacteria bacterium]|nr:ATP-binding protein [Gammaproteobacteria bacterium]MBU0785487.1 ATP-binding protein [Gammaproteobacteria bacterium]MBU0813687.1 ATP-binding protein [Gammaproteobacteria bacterium]MBU1788841.1 ATP-binding protein [Gammaproteobacteria bacterium]
MKNSADVDTLLEKRLSWAAKHPSDSPSTRSWPSAFRLRQGELLTKSGWVRREMDAAQCPPGLPVNEVLDRVCAYWLAEWSRLDAVAQKAREAEEVLINKQLQKRWVEFGPPSIYRPLVRGSFRVSTDEQRTALAKVDCFPWSEADDTDDTEFSTLALIGTPGTGKTHLAALFLRKRMLDEGEDGRFISAAQLVREVRRSWDHREIDETEVIEHFGSVGALVIDDIGVDTSEGAVRVLVEVLDQRLANGVVTCFTSNLSATELREIFGPRGYSRLMAQAQVVVLTGSDHRLEKPCIAGRSRT